MQNIWGGEGVNNIHQNRNHKNSNGRSLNNNLRQIVKKKKGGGAIALQL